MSETTEQVQEKSLEGTPTFKMSIGDTAKTLQTYVSQADSTLAQLQTSIGNANNQIQEWRRMELMIVGQKQLAIDLLSKIVETPKTTDK